MEFLPVIVTSLLLFVLGTAMGFRAMRVLRLAKRQSLDATLHHGPSVPVTIVILAQEQEQDLRKHRNCRKITAALRSAGDFTEAFRRILLIIQCPDRNMSGAAQMKTLKTVPKNYGNPQ